MISVDVLATKLLAIALQANIKIKTKLVNRSFCAHLLSMRIEMRYGQKY